MGESFDRRRFLQRVGLIGAFGIPAVATFSLTELSPAAAAPKKHLPKNNQANQSPNGPRALPPSAGGNGI